MEKKSFISIAQTYFERFRSFKQLINNDVPNDLSISVVIPCYDEPDLKTTLESIQNFYLPEGTTTEVIIVVNFPESEDEIIRKTSQRSCDIIQEFHFKNKENKLNFYCLYHPDLPNKHAGVGWARKIGMDEALRRFMKIDHDGVICCFDADSVADKNYLVEVLDHYNNSNCVGASIYFEHPVCGKDHHKNIYDSVILYETHLRYYKNALKFCGFPYAYHTVGSSMSVKASAYAKQGGMNRKKAGEDFYFINKIISLGTYSEINSTRVVPSPRTSHRVPFGTGRAISESIDGKKDLNLTYSIDIFLVLKEWINAVLYQKDHNYNNFNEFIRSFLSLGEWNRILAEIKKHTASDVSFRQRFFHVFDAFWVLKYVHHVRDNFISDSSIVENVNKLICQFNYPHYSNALDILKELRKLDKTP